MSIDPSKLDAYHERLGIKPARHAFTAGGGKNGKPTSGCVICPYSEGHAAHQGNEVVSLAQFRDSRRQQPLPGRPSHIDPSVWATRGHVEDTKRKSEAFMRKLFDS